MTSRRAAPSAERRRSELRAVLDALRAIVQALRLSGGGARRGVSSAQLFALQQIAEQPRLSINELAARTFTHQSSVSVVVQRLVARQLVAKVAAPDDRRRLCLELTASGRRALLRAPTSVQARLIEAITNLPAEQRRVLGSALAQIARTVAPDIVGRAPMLFEERSRGEKERGKQHRPKRQ